MIGHRIEAAGHFITLLAGNDAAAVNEILENPEFWATEYRHAWDRLGAVDELQQALNRAEAHVKELSARMLVKAAEKQAIADMEQDEWMDGVAHGWRMAAGLVAGKEADDQRAP